MNATPKQVYSLCPSCSACPTVEVYDDGTVRIGEGSNQVTLQSGEWNELVNEIQTGALGVVSPS